MREALATLPWVEHATIRTDVKKQEVRFGMKDKTQFDEEALKKAIQAQGFAEVSVKVAPP